MKEQSVSTKFQADLRKALPDCEVIKHADKSMIGERAVENNQLLDHIAFALVHGSFEGPGGCSCGDCTYIRTKAEAIRMEEATKFYEEHYPPAGGLL